MKATDWWPCNTVLSTKISCTGLHFFLELCINTTLFLVLKMLYTSTEYIQVDFRLDFFMVANSMNPDQTAHKGAV